MIKNDFLSKLVSQLSEAIPEHFNTLKNDFEKNCRTILGKSFAKLDLVTREEFDIQTKVLLRTRKKIELLEKELSAIKAKLAEKPRKD